MNPKSLGHAGAQNARGMIFEGLKYLSNATERFWLSKWYFPAMLFLSSIFAAFDQYIAGTVVMLCLGILFLSLCPDFLACVCPLVMVCVMVGPKYEDLSGFIPYCVLLIFLSMALVLHLVLWPVPTCAGRSTKGLVLVSVATLLGGCNVMSTKEFLHPLSLYYTFGLGVIMLVLYLLFRSQIAQPRSYNLQKRFAAILYTIGLLMSVVIISHYAQNWHLFLESGNLLFLKCRNFAATILLTTLPISFYLTLHNRPHLLGTAVMLIAMVLTESRSALLFGVIEAMLGCAYLIYYKIVSWRAMGIFLVLFGVFMALFGFEQLGALYANRFVNGQLISKEEIRWDMLEQGVRDFLKHPLFGMGLGNTSNKYLTLDNVPGSMFFYHNMPVQILGSMGILGIIAYGKFFSDRVSLLLTKRNAFTAALALCYLGMVMISMTNPGEFCPFPNAGLMVIIFAVVEEAVDDTAVPVSQLLSSKHRFHHAAYTVSSYNKTIVTQDIPEKSRQKNSGFPPKKYIIFQCMSWICHEKSKSHSQTPL